MGNPAVSIIQSAVQFAFTVIINGGHYSQTFQITSDCKIIVPDGKTYDRAQSTVYQAIVEFALESCREW
jgi:hypothetical protein